MASLLKNAIIHWNSNSTVVTGVTPLHGKSLEECNYAIIPDNIMLTMSTLLNLSLYREKWDLQGLTLFFLLLSET